MDETKPIIFQRTCNYWIDAGIVGLFDTLNMPAPKVEIGEWQKTIKAFSGIKTDLKPDALVIHGSEKEIDRALSYALDRIRTTLYDVSSMSQINSPEKDGRVKQMSTIAGEVVATGKQAKSFTYFREDINTKIGKENIFFPLKPIKSENFTTCVFCGQEIDFKLNLNAANEIFTDQTKKTTPFIEGERSNRCFHSYHKGSKKCWQCGFITYFAPLLLYYRRVMLKQSDKDTYYMMPFVPGNLQATYKLYRSLSGKRGLAKVIGSDHSQINYETFFKNIPIGIPAFTLSFYFDLYNRLLPKTGSNLTKRSIGIGLMDNFGSVFQAAVFLKRDNGPKTFIMRELTIDRSVYFLKLFTYLESKIGKNGNLGDSLRALVDRANDNSVIWKRLHIQKISTVMASQAITEGKPAFRFLLPILISELDSDKKQPYKAYQIINLFQAYDQWILKEDKDMGNIVEQAKAAGWFLGQEYWKHHDWDDNEKENLIKRYYYSIERSPSPVKFLDQARHAYKKVEKEIPREMVFHKEDGKEDIKKFEVYRVYFLAGLLNSLIGKGKNNNSVSPVNGSQKEVENE